MVGVAHLIESLIPTLQPIPDFYPTNKCIPHLGSPFHFQLNTLKSWWQCVIRTILLVYKSNQNILSKRLIKCFWTSILNIFLRLELDKVHHMNELIRPYSRKEDMWPHCVYFLALHTILIVGRVWKLSHILNNHESHRLPVQVSNNQSWNHITTLKGQSQCPLFL